MADDSPPERDVKDFEFQQLCKIRLSPSPGSIPNPRVQWLTASSKFGLTFVAAQNGFKVLKTEDIPRLAQDHTVDRLQHVVTDFPELASVTVKGDISHIALSSDDLTLAVATTQPDISFLNFYDVRAFAAQITTNVTPFLTARLNGSPGSTLLDLSWNPAIPSLLVTCMSDGRLDMFEITDKLGMKANVPAAKARCVCWSPKGKQLVAGREDGTLMQYDPDLKEKRKWDYPTIFPDDSYQAVDVVWLSTFTFLVAYISKGADSGEQPQVVMLNGGKDTPPTYFGFDDVCYGTGEERQRKYFFSFIPQWDMVLAGSSNASEIGIIGKHYDSKSTWERWNLDDAARAECPLTDDYVDTYPMGVAVDFTSQTPIPKGESETYPPSPLLLVLTTDGLMIPYHMIYTHKNTPVITAHKEQLPATSVRKSAGQAPSDTGLPTSQPGGQKLFGAESVTISSGTIQSEAKPAFGMGTTSFSFTAPTSSAAQPKPFAFSGAGSTTPKLNFNPEKNATSTPKSTPLVTSDSAVALTKSSSAAPNVNLFKPSDSSTQPLNLGLGKGATQPGTFQFGQSSAMSASKPFTFGTPLASSTPGFSALAAASTAKTSASDPSRLQPATTAVSGIGSQATTSQKPFTSSTASAGLATTTKAATSAFSGLGITSSAKSATASPLTFGSSPTAQSVGAQKPTMPGMPSQQPVIGAASGSTSFAKTAAVGASTTTPSQQPVIGATSGSANFTKTAAIGASTSTGALSATGLAGGQGRPGLSGIGSLGAGVKPPPPYTAAAKTDSVPRPPSPIQAPPPDQEPSFTASVDYSFSKSISEEIEHFQKEMRDLKARASGSMFVVGDKEEMHHLKGQTENISDFWKDIRNTTQDHSKEIQDQRSLCLDMFAMVEECRSREQLNSDPKYSHLLKMQALDPGSLEKLQQLQLQYQVLDKGIKDVDLILDTHWEEYQERKKNKTNRVQRPTNDAIYRIMKSNTNIIQCQKTKLKELEQRLKQLKLANQTSSWQPNLSSIIYDRQNEQTELSTLADSLVNPSVLHRPANQSFANYSQSSVNQSKLAKLRDHLYRRHVPVVKSTRPENLSMSRLLVPQELLQQRVERQQPQESAIKSTAWQEPFPTPGMSGNFTGMFRRSSPAHMQMTDNTGGAFTLNQSKEPFTMTQQRIPSFTMNNAQSVPGTTTTTAKAQGFSNFPTSKLPSGSVLGNNPLTAANVGKSTGMVLGGQGASAAGVPSASLVGVPSVVREKITQGPHILSNVAEINGQTFEDITPEESTENEEEEEDDEEGEYDEEDEYEEEESNGVGFGLPYIEVQGSTVTSSTPVSTRVSKSEQSQTPVSRKLFGGDGDPKPATTGFNFGVGADVPGTFTFGSLSAPDTSKADTKKDVTASKAFVFTPLALATTKGNIGFNFATASSGTGSVDQISIPGAAGGDSLTKSTSIGEDRKSPVSVDTKTGTGFNIRENAAKPKNVSEVSSSDSHSSRPSASQSTVGPLTVSSTTSTQPSKSLSSLLESKSSSSEELSEENGAAVEGSSGVAVTESESQSGVPFPVSSSSGVDDSDLKATSSTSGGLFGQSASSLSTDSSSQSEIRQPAGKGVQPTAAGTAEIKQLPDSDDTAQKGTNSSVGLFGQAKTISASSGMFGQTAATSSGGLFGQPSSGIGLFGTAASTSGSGSLFVSAAAATSSSGSLFGSATTASSTGGLFGTATTSSSTGGRGTVGTATTTSDSGGLFGTATSTSGPATTTSGSGGSFGTATATSGSGGSFGTATTTSGSGGSFDTATATSGSGGLFGTATTTSGSGGIFGSATPNSGSGGLFGTATTSSGSAGLFGSTATTLGTSGSFGSATASSGSGVPFGSSTTTSGAGPFGSATTTGGLFGSGSTSSGSLFGQPSNASSPFGRPSGDQPGSGLFGQPSSGSSSVFGQQSSSTSSSGGFGAFGSSTGSGFGTATSGSGFGFGQQSTATSGFGSFGQSPAFGQPPRSGSGFPSGDLGGGGLFSGLGGKPSAEKAGTNVFGSGQSFGSASQDSSGLFGSGGAKTFGNAATSSAGGSFSGGTGGAFSSGSGSTGSTGFNGLTSGGSGFGSPPSFGGTPAFGGAPKFGSGAAFGGQATFGSGSTFGSPPAFGNPAGGGTFGSSSPATAGGFASFASGSSPTFGALAQSSDSPSFGTLNQAAGGDGGNVFGGGGGFGSPSFGGQQNTAGFGGNPFGSSPSFTGYRG